jgi:hypothetical protein
VLLVLTLGLAVLSSRPMPKIRVADGDDENDPLPMSVHGLALFADTSPNHWWIPAWVNRPPHSESGK